MSKLAKIARSVRPRAAKTLTMNPFLNHSLEDFFSPSPFLSSWRSPLFDTPLIPTFDDNVESSMERFRSTFLPSPGYEIRELDKNKFQIQMDLPGIKPSDMNIELVDDANVLRVYGSRKLTKDDKTVSEAYFEKRFSVGENVDINQVTANLSDGVLTLVVPKQEAVEKPVVKIPITEGPVENEKDSIPIKSGASEVEHKEEEEHPKAA
jgi:HSP20 family protein